MNLVPQLHLDVLAFTGYPNVSLTKFTKKIHGRSSLLAQGELKGILLAALFYGFFNVIGHTVKTVCRAEPVYPLVGPLVVVIADPVIEPLASIGKGGKSSFLQELCPDRLPEPLDLAQGHGVVGSRAYVADPLALQHLLEPGLATPGRELPAVVREDLPGRAPLTDSALHHFEHGLRGLLAEQAVTYDVAGVVVNDTHQVDLIHTLELESEDVDLP